MPGQRNNRRAQQPLDLSYGHVMPQAIEMEKAVLGALMIDKDAYLEVCDLLKPESFYEPRNQIVYDAIMKLSMEESPVDVLTVTDMLGKMGKLDEVGGPGYIAELSSRVATSANIEYHAITQTQIAEHVAEITVTYGVRKTLINDVCDVVWQNGIFQSTPYMIVRAEILLAKLCVEILWIILFP